MILPICSLIKTGTMKQYILFFLLCLGLAQLQAQLTPLSKGMHISSSVKIKPGVYHLNYAGEPFTAVIEIEGNNLVVDFNNAVLDGNIHASLPDQFFGVAINIKAGKNITIKNLTAKGYKVALMAKGIEGLTIEHCDFSYNYRQHLNSTQQKEDLSDWMSYHHNEKDEWLRYGAAMYLRGCNKAVVHDNLVTGGQCALMLTQCDSGMIYNNIFSYNSGIGVGMYRSSANKIMYNRLNFNVRGHSEGVYNRGQDAAAILVFEQCNNNVYAFNSATHSGDGFFLWAGQTTMDSGEGGCNDNFIFANDFSYAPTNGIEVTFSRNRISENTIYGCDNAIWGGYSYNTVIVGNTIDSCSMGIAIEHGQDNTISVNSITHCKEAVKLWARASQPADWVYANRRDTRSRNYRIDFNQFWNNQLVFDFLLTSNIAGKRNDTIQNKIFQKSDTVIRSIRFGDFPKSYEDFDSSYREKKREKEISYIRMPWRTELKKTDSSKMGRRQIRMTEWGPYDFRSPLIWNTNPASTSDTMLFEIIGPEAVWKLVNQRGVKIITQTNAAITAIKTNQKGEDVFIELEYTGKEIVTPFGEKIAQGKPYRFNYRNNLLPANWKVNCFAFDSTQNPIKNPEFIKTLEKQVPVFAESSTGLDYAWWNGVGKEKKYEQFLTVAETDIDFPPGEYVLAASWEDVLHIYIDGHLLLDEWKPAGHVYDESPHRDLPVNLAGKHHIRVEQANQAGFATLIIKLKKK